MVASIGYPHPVLAIILMLLLRLSCGCVCACIYVCFSSGVCADRLLLIA